MVVNFVVVVSAEDGDDVGVTGVFPFPALGPAKRKADKIKNEYAPYDVVVWDVNTNEAVYSPYNEK